MEENNINKGNAEYMIGGELQMWELTGQHAYLTYIYWHQCTMFLHG